MTLSNKVLWGISRDLKPLTEELALCCKGCPHEQSIQFYLYDTIAMALIPWILLDTLEEVPTP